MSASNVNGNALPSSTSRKRSAAGRVVPAIPLPMSKPRRQTKPATSVPPKQQQSNTQEEQTVQQGGPQAAENVNESQHNGLGSENSEGLENGQEHARSSSDNRADALGSASVSASSNAETDSAQPLDAVAAPVAPVQTGEKKLSGTQSSTPSKRSTDGLDLRQIRTELPPAFVPSASVQHTPASASSSQTRHRPQLPYNDHVARSSVSGIVFGGTHDSSSSSPAPPRSNSSTVTSTGFRPPAMLFQEQVNFPAHAQTVPEPYYEALQSQPAVLNGTRAVVVDPNHQLQQYHHSVPGHSTPAEQPAANGFSALSRPESQASSVVDGQRRTVDVQLTSPADQTSEFNRDLFQEGSTMVQGNHGPRRSLPARHMPPPPLTPVDMHLEIENAMTLRDHVRSSFGSPDFADCHLSIADDYGNRRSFDAHKVILARSPALAAIVRNSPATQSASLKTQVVVHLSARYVQTDALVDGIRYLYGGPSLLPEHFQTAASNQEQMDLAIHSIAVGTWLKIPAIAARAVEIAGRLLHWDTISAALAFALDGGLNPIWMDHENTDDISAASSDSSYGRPEASGMPTYDPLATQLLHRIIDFTVHLFPNNFFLDTSAPQLEASQRLPPVAPFQEHRQSLADPRLSHIRFGEMAAVNEPQRPSPVTTVISSLLMSLPFPLLKVILEHPVLTQRLGADTVGSIMRAVVTEREVRRRKALAAVERFEEGSGPSAAFHNLHWIETVEPSAQHRAGFKLVRRRKGVDTPLSSGQVSEGGSK